MIVTIIILVALLFIFALVFGARFVYLLASSSHSKNTMQSETKTKALDLFLYLGIAIALIVSVSNLLQILFEAINRKFVDVLPYASYVDETYSDVRFAVASLVVMFPIYVGISWFISKDIKKYLYKQDIPVRKVMIYCTLFVAVLTLIGTLVSIIYTYLGGEISARFIAKAVAVFGVALSLFGYYYYSLRRNYSQKTSTPLVITIVASLVVISSIVWSVSVIGSPAVMRAKKFDSVRLSDISRIQQEVFNKFQASDKLPLTLSELNNAFQGYQVPADPVTKEAYQYKVVQQPVVKMNYTTNKKEMVSPAVFELCSTFGTVRKYDERGQNTTGASIGGDMYSASNYYYDGDRSPFWNHEAGETCFKRVISPEMYYGR